MKKFLKRVFEKEHLPPAKPNIKDYQEKGPDGFAVARMTREFQSKFKDVYAHSTLLSFTAVGPMQTYLGFLVDQGYIELTEKSMETYEKAAGLESPETARYGNELAKEFNYTKKMLGGRNI